MTRWIQKRMHQDERAFTLLELLVSLAVLAIIMTPLVAAFIDSIKQANDVQTKVGASADAQRIASFWTADVQNLDPNGYTPLGSGQNGECPAPPGSATPLVEQTLATFEWDTSSSAVDYDASSGTYITQPKKATWVVEGQGPNAELVRRYCVLDKPVREDFVAGSFWKSGYDAAKLIHGPGGYGQYDYCATDGKTCTISVSGNYQYSLTVDRRVQGVAPPTASTPPCPVITGAIGANTTITVAWLPSVVSDGLPPVDQYRVIVTALPGGSVLSSATVGSTSLSAELTGLVNGVGYYVQTQAHNDNGWGILCDPYGPVSPQPVAPGAVTNVGAVRGDQQITVSWSPPTDDGGAAVNTWRIRTRLTATSELLATTDIAGNAARTGVVTGLTNGKEVYATVSAINSAGEGPESTQSNAVTPCGLPFAPGSYVLNDNGTPSDPNDDYQVWTPAKPTLNDAGNQAIKVTWQASDGNGCAVSNYKVYATPAFNGAQPSPWTTPTDATSYTTPSLAANVAYQFQVSAINAVGEGPLSPLSDPLAAAQVPTAAPGNLQWTPDYFGVRGDTTPNLGGHLTWTPVPDTPEFNGGSSILGYHIKQMGNCDPGNGATQGTAPNQYCPFQANGANSTGFDFGNMVQVTGTYPNEAYKHYTMRVQSFNDRGDNLTPSEVDVVPGGRPTGSPGNVQFVGWSAGSSSSAISVSWDRMADTLANTGGLPIGGSAGSGPAYKIMWSPNAQDGSNSYTVNGVNNLSQALGNFVPGQAYTFKVAAVNSLGASIPGTSFVVYAPSQLSAPPASSLTITRPSSFGTQGNQLLLTIPAFSTNPGNPTINYSAVCKAGGEADVTFTGLVVGANTLYSTGLTNGKQWSCTVTATTTYGNGTTSSATQTTSGTAAPYTTPGATGTPTVTAISGGKARISWTAPANNGGQAPDYYTITSSPSISGLPANVNVPATTYDTTVALTYGQSYTFTVSAHNGAGNGPGTTSAAYSPTQSLPVAPTNLTWTPVYQNQIRFNWTPVLDNQPANGGSSLTGQVMTISPAPTTTPTSGLAGPCTAISGGLQCPLAVATNTFTFSTNQLSSGNYVNYTFTIAAVNSVGTGPAASTTGKAGGVPLTAVTNLTYTPGAANGNIRLDWTPVAGGSLPDNGGQNVTGYNVRCTTGGNNCGSSYPYFIGGYGQTGTYLGGFTPGVAYTLSIVANNSPTGNPSGDAAVVATVVVTAPGPPTPVGSATVAQSSSPTAFGWLELTFPAWSVNSGSPAIQDYSARCTSSNGGVQVDAGPLYGAGASLVPGTINNIKNLTSGKTYTCLVTARNYFPYSSTYGTATQTTSNSAVPR